MSEDLTPMMCQYQAIKRQYPDGLLFFRLGDFYEMFGKDAEVASRLLGITLTSRNKNKEQALPLCGVPHHSASGYIARLVKQGHKVIICDQVEDPKVAKGIVKREVVRVVTPGTVWEDNLLEEKSNNYLVGLQQYDQQIGLAALDLSTGEFRVTQFAVDNASHKSLENEIARLSPGEILLPSTRKSWAQNVFSPENFNLPAQNLVYLDDWIFEPEQAYRLLLERLKTTSLKGFGCEYLSLSIQAAGAVLYYVHETQKSDLAHINSLRTYHLNDYLVIAAATVRNLEIIQNIQDNQRRGSLLSLLDQTVTAMGGRCLKSWLLHPLLDIHQLQNRQAALEELLSAALRQDLRQHLQRVYDLERLIGRVAMGKASARDLVALKVSLEQIPRLKQTLIDCKSWLIRELDGECTPLPELVELIAQAIIDEPPLSLKEGGFIRTGYNTQLDELRHLSGQGKDWIARLEETERRRTGINSLKVRYNKVFGYYIEITNANLAAAPADYIRKQTLSNAERFITPALKEYEEKVLGAEDKICALEEELFQQLRIQVAAYIPALQKTAQALARLDALASLSEVAAKNNYCKPELHTGTELKISGGRHPVVENVLSDKRFVPNDTQLDNDDNRLLIITGPNMAGKSTYLRQVALITLMAQIGSFVPADSVSVGVVDQIFSRVGAADNLLRGESTFMVEMNETANILNNATKRSLIILDEIGRGTSTFDGLSIAWAVAEYIHDRNTLGAKTLFATHYHELTDLAIDHPGVKNCNIAVREWNEEIIFLYKIIPGGCDRSYGIQVAKLAGLPAQVIARAKEILANLESKELDAQGVPAISHTVTPQVNAPKQLSLFMPILVEEPLLKEIKDLNITQMTPLEALNKLATWQERLKRRK
ncbi:MAG: DNA mismatch repair protein MutS [Candidatus Schekmanbacteria bacterium]|nr:DNA mismatch repair protein MutS [Candidatus Schekmanbacteria bacterium]